MGPYAWTAIGAAGVGSLYFGYTQINNANPGLPKPKASSTPGPAPAQFKGGDQGFVLLKLESIENINQNTKKFRFAFEDEKMESGLPVACEFHIAEGEGRLGSPNGSMNYELTRVSSGGHNQVSGPGDGETRHQAVHAYQRRRCATEPPRPLERADSIPPDTQGHMDFVIKRYPNGPMSEHMHNMAPGQRLDIKGPIPKYPMETNKHRHVAMIAGGTGITPMYQVMRRIFKDPEDKTEVTLVFGNITEDDILLKKELAELENTYPRRFHAVYTLDKPPEGSNRAKGFISKDLLKTVLPEPKEENVKIFVCGRESPLASRMPSLCLYWGLVYM